MQFPIEQLNSSRQIVASATGILLYNDASFYTPSGRWLIVDAKPERSCPDHQLPEKESAMNHNSLPSACPDCEGVDRREFLKTSILTWAAVAASAVVAPGL